MGLTVEVPEMEVVEETSEGVGLVGGVGRVVAEIEIEESDDFREDDAVYGDESILVKVVKHVVEGSKNRLT